MRVTGAEKREIARSAKRVRLTLSEFLRAAIREKIQRESKAKTEAA